MSMMSIKLYRPGWGYIGTAEIPDLRPGVGYPVLLWEHRAFVQQSACVYCEVPRWHLGRHDVTIAPESGEQARREIDEIDKIPPDGR
jgi:hypothetical protein